MLEYFIEDYKDLYKIFTDKVYIIESQKDLINNLEMLYISCVDMYNESRLYSDKEIEYYVKNNIITPEFLFLIDYSTMNDTYFPLNYVKIYKMFDEIFLEEYFKYYKERDIYICINCKIENYKKYDILNIYGFRDGTNVSNLEIITSYSF
uniref:Uncharacterized protein n=1 Tax=Pithovirus LCDPAC02 TaxID=2506601 RepID=A0A481YPE9_9VIRU|nr:MAG: hypothetical protein LCDPAC02_03210 [Pithovirus LCDPAC02]